MRWIHLFTAWKDAQNPIGLPRKNEAETAATSQRHNYVAMNTVYPTWNPVSTLPRRKRRFLLTLTALPFRRPLRTCARSWNT